MNLDTLSSDNSGEEIRDSGSSFNSLIVGAVIYFFHIMENINQCQGEELIYINMYAQVLYWQVHAYCCQTGLHICTINTLVSPYHYCYLKDKSQNAGRSDIGST